MSDFGSDFNEDFFGNNCIEKLESWLKINQDNCPVITATIRLGAPLVRPSKLVYVGLNYAQYATESGMEVPKEPVYSLNRQRLYWNLTIVHLILFLMYNML